MIFTVIGLTAQLVIAACVAGGSFGQDCGSCGSQATPPQYEDATSRMKREHAEAGSLFERLAARYRALEVYQDSMHVERTTFRDGEEVARESKEMACELVDGELTVATPAAQLAAALGLDDVLHGGSLVDEVAQDYAVWLAPHMGLCFQSEPLSEFREGVEDGFTPVRTERVTEGQKQFVRVELRSGDGLSADSQATFNLFVNPTSMLVERVEGRQRLPDGAVHETVMDITPVEFDEYVEPAPS